MAKKKEEMRQLIDAWTKSKKHKELRKQIEAHRVQLNNIVQLDKKELINYIEVNGFSEHRINKLVDDIIGFDELPLDDQEEYGWISELNMQFCDKNELYLDFIINMYTWNIYVYCMQVSESYEICAKLQKVIDLEKKQLASNLHIYFTFEEEDEKIISKIESDIKSKLFS